eukprot:TRINITY_DN28064_c0_g1_i1.p1 TRINITY_DN28064_c0_g1~~TRINITY_DN28064_c0_g1_i1.p1  ORF type:complete len:101 (-),score=18.65 TRINITY_DN28064_c0_g1_i1:27-329(-)
MSITIQDFLVVLLCHKELLLDEDEATEHSYQLVQRLLDSVSDGSELSEEESELKELAFKDHWTYYFDTSPPQTGVRTNDFVERLKELGTMSSVKVSITCD